VAAECELWRAEFGWKVDLEQPALSIAIYATDDHFIVGIPLPEVRT
jgi:hypothetical protein